ncbi:hypothetical protein [Qipengyuania qiaonensis]|uniref:Uncharacterized protein n=1 Tax=Qipengyuania qiaonensis TaxID=2867240 RepID=A0ABS7J2W7_9SPHN|nr:hypothetical protein [Qipengyuania qiaonensis]MBX7481661.1 hypothetical protein [Qipengyuania qiaonensis]
MSFFQRLRSAYQNLERFAEAMEYDPIDHLNRRIDHLEQRLNAMTSQGEAETLDGTVR